MIWDIESGNIINKLYGHNNGVYCLVVLPDGLLASCSYDGTIIIWDIKSGNKINTLYGHTDGVFCLAVLPDGSFI